VAERCGQSLINGGVWRGYLWIVAFHKDAKINLVCDLDHIQSTSHPLNSFRYVIAYALSGDQRRPAFRCTLQGA
jgi:hypothetical protein